MIVWTISMCVAAACTNWVPVHNIYEPIRTKEQCVAEASRKLDEKPQMVFICEEYDRSKRDAEFAATLASIKAGKTPKPIQMPLQSIVMGPKTLKY